MKCIQQTALKNTLYQCKYVDILTQPANIHKANTQGVADTTLTNHTYFHSEVAPKVIRSTSRRYSENYKWQALNSNASQTMTITKAIRVMLILKPRFYLNLDDSPVKSAKQGNYARTLFMSNIINRFLS